MHSKLQQQLQITGLDANKLPADVTAWRDFVRQVEMSYVQTDEVLSTVKCSAYTTAKDVHHILNQAEEGTLEDEKDNAAISEKEPNAIIILDSKACIIEFNDVAERMFGYQCNDVLFQTATDKLIAERFRADYDEVLRCFDIDIVGNIQPQQLNVLAQHADGSQFPVVMSLSSLHVNYKKYITVTIHATKQQSVKHESQKKLALQASFFEEDINLALRFNGQGIVEYSNHPGLGMLRALGINVGDVLSGVLAETVRKVLDENVEETREIDIDGVVYSLHFVPVVDAGFVNVYGTDTGAKKEHKLVAKGQNRKSKTCFHDVVSPEVNDGVSSDKDSQFGFTLCPQQSNMLDMAQDMSQKLNEDSRVLLVEDNLLNQEVAVEMFETLGHKVDLVENGREALNAVKKKKYNLVFMDCRMPVMDGYEATECIRQLEHADGDENRVPIIALTANAMSSDVDKCIHAGMDGFISKPFSLQDLESAMNRW